MTIDPFANADTEPAENTTPNTKESTVTNIVSDQAKIVTTLKGGSGFDAPWIVVHADNATDALETLKDPSMKELIELSQKVGSAFVEAGGGSRKPAAQAAPAQRSNGQPQGATEAAVATPPGYIFKSGMNKAGRAWKAFMGADRNADLPVIFLNDKGYPSPKFQATYDSAMA